MYKLLLVGVWYQKHREFDVICFEKLEDAQKRLKFYRSNGGICQMIIFKCDENNWKIIEKEDR